jgi:prepilin-type processing-associated H-X9-DG protein
VSVLGLGTVTPLHVPQQVVTELSIPLCCDDSQQQEFLERVYLRSGVLSRSTVIPKDGRNPISDLTAFYRPRTSPADRGPTTSERMALYATHAPPLAAASSRQGLESAPLSPQAISHVVSASCTGFHAPGLDIELIRRLGLRPEVQRVHIGFMGCHAAFNALSAARHIAASESSARILVCCTELCSLHLAYGFDAQRIVANALFADGSAAAIIGGSSDGVSAGPELLDTASLLVPDSQDAMTWRIGDHGFEMTLSPNVPSLIRQHVPGWIEAFLAGNDLSLRDIAHFAIHPGGPKILDGVREALSLPEDALWASRQVLAEHGNMSSATILFVIQRLLEHGATGTCLTLGFGPGLMAEAMLLEL